MGAVAKAASHGHAVKSLQIVTREGTKLKPGQPKRRGRARRQSHGAAWHWSQTDTWYYTLPGTRRRVPLFDEDGKRIRGIENKKEAQLAMARVKLGQGWRPV